MTGLYPNRIPIHMDKYLVVNHGLMARVHPKFKEAIGRWTSKCGV
jgi:hypothetical protein